VPSKSNWAFYAPSLVGQQLTDYATGKGYDVLTTINGGEGFWVNAKTAFTVPMPSGTTVTSASFRTTLMPGWNLIATGDNKTPSEFNEALNVTPPLSGEIPDNVITLWAWDALRTNWYFYAPSLVAKGASALIDYIASKGYLDFGSKILDTTIGFWVNRSGAVAPIQLASATTAGASPLSLLTLSATGFDPAAALSVRFFDSQRYSVEVPVAKATAATLTVAVPPFIDLATGAFAGGTVNLQVIQGTGASALASNIQGGFQIRDLPSPATPPGAVTLDFLRATRDVTVQLQSGIKGTQFDTLEMNGALESQASNLDAVIVQVQAAMQSPSLRFAVGSIKAVPLTVGAAELANVDRLIMAILLAQSAGPAQASTGLSSRLLAATEFLKSLALIREARAQSTSTCQQQEVKSIYDGIGNGTYTGFNNYYPSSLALCNSTTPSASAISEGAVYFAAVGAAALGVTYFVGDALGVEAAAAIALPAVAITVPLVVLAAGSILVGGALGNDSPDAKPLLETGVAQIEELLRVAVIKGAALGIPPVAKIIPATQKLGQYVEDIPEPLIAAAGIYAGAKKLVEVFGAALTNNSQSTTTTTTTTASTTTTTLPSGGLAVSIAYATCTLLFRDGRGTPTYYVSAGGSASGPVHTALWMNADATCANWTDCERGPGEPATTSWTATSTSLGGLRQPLLSAIAALYGDELVESDAGLTCPQ
jgi:hypothetical protein